MASSYRGRFAPSPTGRLHLGSLLAAVASFADARAHRGQWLVRIEDLDRPREVPGAASDILMTLERFGLTWDGPVVRQSTRVAAYDEAVSALTASEHLYPCACSRGEIARAGRVGLEGPIYPGTCRAGIPSGRPPRALRIRVPGGAVRFRDRIQGDQQQRVSESVGDFVVRRADGFHAYQLAVVIDDAWQEISDVVRGADLLVSTPRQIMLQRMLGLARPRYAHLPILCDAGGHKLSKSSAAAPIDPSRPIPSLYLAWRLLGQSEPPPGLDIETFWSWAIPHWRMDRVPTSRMLSLQDEERDADNPVGPPRCAADPTTGTDDPPIGSPGSDRNPA
jgi:glutamyl-Q tRNA(Asp) synthetase